MKKRILSMLLAMVMILSTAALAVSATDTDAGAGTTTYPVAQNVNGLPVTVDGLKTASEGWSSTPILQTTQATESVFTETGIEDTNPSSLYISSDGEYVYFYYEIVRPELLNTNWKSNGSGGWNMPGFALYFAPSEANFLELEKEDGAIFINFRIFMASIQTGMTAIDGVPGSYKWTSNTIAETAGAYTDFVGGVCYGSDWYSNDQEDGTSSFGQVAEIALNRETDADGKETKLGIEIAFKLNEETATALETGTSDWRVAAYEYTHTYNGAVLNNAGYMLSDKVTASDSNKYDFAPDCGATITLPTAVPAPKVVEPNFNKIVTVDGEMGEDEGWSAEPMFVTTINASHNNIQAETTLKQEDTDPTTIRISCDGQKVYFFIESTHYDTLNATWYDCNAGKTDENGNALAADWQTPTYYLHFYPDSDKPRSEYGVDNGHWFTAAFPTFRWYGLKDANLDENGTLIWDMNQDGANESFFWRLLWGPEGSNQYSKEFRLSGVELAAHIDKDADGERIKLSVEFAFPLATEVVTALENGDITYKFAFVERTNRYQDMSAEEPTWVTSKDAGYYLNDTMVDSRLKTDEMDFGIPVTLKQNTDTTYSDFIAWLEDYKASAEYDNLENLVVNLYGDDYLIGGGIADYYKWTSIMDEIYNWDIKDYTEAGIMTSTFDDIQLYPLCRNYRNMSSNNPDVVLVSGGWNDYLNGVPIGTITDTDTDTYMGALNTLIDGLRAKFPDACLVFTTVYNFTGTIEGGTLTSEDYATAMMQVCEAKQVYCFNAYDPEVSGIDMSDDAFRATYCRTANDTVNFNVEGMKLIAPKYEKFISESLAHWAENKEEILANQNKDNTNEGGNTNNDSNNTQNGGNDTTTETTPTETTPAPVEPAKKGCGSVIGVGSALAVLAIVSCAGAVCFKKHD